MKLTTHLLIKRAENFALGQVFATWPSENQTRLTFDEICLLCENKEALEKFNESLDDEFDDERLGLSEQYENEWWSNIPFILNNFKHSFYNTLIDIIDDS